MEDLAKNRCAVCDETKSLKRCGVCKCTFYCSREHQMKDWNRHKQQCGKFKQNTDSASVKHSDAQRPSMEDHTDQEENDHDLKVDNGSTKDSPHAISVGAESDCVPFDERPFKKIDFDRLNPNVDEHEIAKVATKNLNRNGYCVIDQLFTCDQIRAALGDIHGLVSGNQLKPGMLAGGRASDSDSEKVLNLDIRSDKIMWVEGIEKDLPGITTIVTKMDKIFLEINVFLRGKHVINGRTKAMVACYPGNKTYYRRHVDNPNKDGRICTCILYLNEGWDVEKDGGLLRIFPEGTSDCVDVAPIANRLLFFWCDRRNPHEVQPALRQRFAITVWYMDKEERARAKLDTVDAEMARLRGEYALQEVHQRRREVDEVSTKLEENAARAIASLSLEELKALSVMVEDSPDPHAPLSQLGIGPSIQTKLLEKLRQR